MKKQSDGSGQRFGILRRNGLFSVLALFVVFLLASCAQPSHRPPPVRYPSSLPPQPPPPPKATAPEGRPSSEPPKIKEQDLKDGRRGGQPNITTEGKTRLPPQEPAGLPPDEGSLVAKISPQTSPRRAASLRLTEEGKKLLAAEDYSRALARLERSITVDSTNPYSYYYLAKTHYHLGRHQESLNFLDVAESHFSAEPYWLAETFAMRGENFRALGFMQRAEANYAQALKLNPASRVATEGLNRLRSVSPRIAR